MMEFKQAEQFFLSGTQYQAIQDCLGALADKLHVVATLLIDRSGRVLAKRVQEGRQIHETYLGALAAGSYAAAGEMAPMLGEEKQFEMILHEGRVLNALIASVDVRYCLVVVFPKEEALGMVRLFTKRTVGQILPILQSSERPEELITNRFQNLLDQALDESFKEF